MIFFQDAAWPFMGPRRLMTKTGIQILRLIIVPSASWLTGEHIPTAIACDRAHTEGVAIIALCHARKNDWVVHCQGPGHSIPTPVDGRVTKGAGDITQCQGRSRGSPAFG